MKTLKTLLACLLAGMAPVHLAWAQQEYETACHIHEPQNEPREHAVDFQTLDLSLKFQPREGKVMGRAQYTFRVLRNTDSLILDGPGLTIESIEDIRGKRALPIRYRQDGEHLILYFSGPGESTPLLAGQNGVVDIRYTAQPRKGIYFIGWNDATNRSRKQIWTQGQAQDHRYWIPGYDDPNDKLVTSLTVTFDSSYQVLSNGNLTRKAPEADGTHTWTYRMERPHALYLIMLTVGKYAIENRQTRTGVPLHLWYYPDHKDRVEWMYKYSAECVEFMEEETGVPYPWGSYAQVPVQDFIFGAMENTGATIFGDFFDVDARAYLDRNYVNVNCHELVHQWFGDYITHRAFKDIWLHESYATYYAKLFEGRLYGPEHYQHNLRQEQESALSAAERDDYPVRHTKAGTSRHYPKGSAVVHMLRYVLGEDSYKRAINHYLRKHAFDVVETNDLYQSIQDTLGLTLNWFFDQWIYRGGEPHYRVNHRSIPGATEVTVEQIHRQTPLIGLFRMPVRLHVYYADGTIDSTLADIQQQTEVIRLPNAANKAVSFVLFDPGSHVLKRISHTKTLAELKAQALNAKQMIDRYDAVAALAQHPLRERLPIFRQLFQREKFHRIPAEIVRQLAQVDSLPAEGLELLQAATKHPWRPVRQAVVQELRFIPREILPQVENLLRDSSYTVVELALDKLADQYPENLSRYLQATASVRGAVGNNVRVKWLEVAAHSGNRKALTELIDLTSNAWEFRTRSLAMGALKRLNVYNAEVQRHLLDALYNPNTRLSALASGVLGYFVQQRQYRAGLQALLKNRSLKPWQRKLLEGAVGKS